MNWALKDLLIAFVFFALCAFLNASMDVTKHNFKSSIYSQIGDKESPTYKYFASHWTNKWEYQYTLFSILVEGELVSWETVDYQGKDIWFILDKDGKRISRYFLGIRIIGLNHPMFSDSWHLFKAVMIGSFIIALIALYFAAARNIFSWKRWESWAVALTLFILFSLDWNLFFNLFYDNLLRL